MGQVHKHNCRIWGYEKPTKVLEAGLARNSPANGSTEEVQLIGPPGPGLNTMRFSLMGLFKAKGVLKPYKRFGTSSSTHI